MFNFNVYINRWAYSRVNQSTCIAPCMVQTTLKRSGMDHTAFNLQRTPCLLLPDKRSSDGASTECGGEHLNAAHYSFINPERMKGWVGLIGWPIADGLPTHQLQVERRTAIERWPETDVLPLSHAELFIFIKFAAHVVQCLKHSHVSANLARGMLGVSSFTLSHNNTICA